MAVTVNLDDLLTTKEAASVLGVKPNTLEIWRHKGRGPPFIRLGDGPCAPIRYFRIELSKWLASHSYAHTSAYSPSAQTSDKFNKCRSTGASC
ncbi:helix-turn-helix transcriptional regulator [Brevundimonas vesicularis]|uniref:helix-turn-helix transcriptional regulator n=1 Tax=Brevundimonas vesicularis TaxID=41276 RepID=UPI0022ABF61C|nr:helix-turn-helix domain-containing protein [Brevundimonas vesicularis]